MSKKYIVANWKMHFDCETLTSWLDHFSQNCLSLGDHLQVVIAPTAIHIPSVCSRLESLKVAVGAQDISHYEKGSHTGNLGAFQVKDFCKFCIVGHSERQEPLELATQKRDLCLRHGIIPIVCFDSPYKASEVYQKGAVFAWEDPENISKEGLFSPKDPNEISLALKEIKKLLPSDSVVLYGGSVNRQNIQDLVNISELDGVLVGSASTDPEHFLELIKAYEIS